MSATHPFVRMSVAFVIIVAVGVLGVWTGADAKGPNGGVLTVKARERDCAITAVATFDKTLYQTPTATVAIKFWLVDENTTRWEQQAYPYLSRDTQRISNTFTPLTPSATPNTFAIEVELLRENGDPGFQGGSPEISVNCDLPLIG